MASEIIAFVVDHWEDVLITIVVGLAILGFDYFFLRKKRTDSTASNSLTATDRLIIVVFAGLFLYITWGPSPVNGSMVVICMLLLSFLVAQRQRLL